MPLSKTLKEFDEGMKRVSNGRIRFGLNNERIKQFITQSIKDAFDEVMVEEKPEDSMWDNSEAYGWNDCKYQFKKNMDNYIKQ